MDRFGQDRDDADALDDIDFASRQARRGKMQIWLAAFTAAAAVAVLAVVSLGARHIG
jgi:hypothetical protein